MMGVTPRMPKVAGALLNVALMIMLGAILAGLSYTRLGDWQVAWITGCLPAFVFWWTSQEWVCK